MAKPDVKTGDFRSLSRHSRWSCFVLTGLCLLWIYTPLCRCGFQGHRIAVKKSTVNSGLLMYKESNDTFPSNGSREFCHSRRSFCREQIKGGLFCSICQCYASYSFYSVEEGCATFTELQGTAGSSGRNIGQDCKYIFNDSRNFVPTFTDYTDLQTLGIKIHLPIDTIDISHNAIRCNAKQVYYINEHGVEKLVMENVQQGVFELQPSTSINGTVHRQLKWNSWHLSSRWTVLKGKLVKLNIECYHPNTEAEVASCILFKVNGTYREIHQSCKNVKMINSAARDGEYELWYPRNSTFLKIFCHNITGAPTEYLTLPAGGATNYVYKGGPSNSPTWGKSCRGEFSKVRLLLTNPLRILRSDTTFMTTDEPDCSPLLRNNGDPTQINGYGGAGGCSGIGTSTGKFQIDLSGTFYRVRSNVSWKIEGWKDGDPRIREFMKSSDGKNISAFCGGYCGWCNPSTGKYIPLILIVNLSTTATTTVLTSVPPVVSIESSTGAPTPPIIDPSVESSTTAIQNSTTAIQNSTVTMAPPVGLTPTADKSSSGAAIGGSIAGVLLLIIAILIFIIWWKKYRRKAPEQRIRSPTASPMLKLGVTYVKTPGTVTDLKENANEYLYVDGRGNNTDYMYPDVSAMTNEKTSSTPCREQKNPYYQPGDAKSTEDTNDSKSKEEMNAYYKPSSDDKVDFHLQDNLYYSSADTLGGANTGKQNSSDYAPGKENINPYYKSDGKSMAQGINGVPVKNSDNIYYSSADNIPGGNSHEGDSQQKESDNSYYYPTNPTEDRPKQNFNAYYSYARGQSVVNPKSPKESYPDSPGQPPNLNDLDSEKDKVNPYYRPSSGEGHEDDSQQKESDNSYYYPTNPAEDRPKQNFNAYYSYARGQSVVNPKSPKESYPDSPGQPPSLNDIDSEKDKINPYYRPSNGEGFSSETINPYYGGDKSKSLPDSEKLGSNNEQAIDRIGTTQTGQSEVDEHSPGSRDQANPYYKPSDSIANVQTKENDNNYYSSADSLPGRHTPVLSKSNFERPSTPQKQPKLNQQQAPKMYDDDDYQDLDPAYEINHYHAPDVSSIKPSGGEYQTPVISGNTVADEYQKPVKTGDNSDNLDSFYHTPENVGVKGDNEVVDYSYASFANGSGEKV